MVRNTALILLTIVSPWLLVAMMFSGAGLIWLGTPAICLLPMLLIVVGTEGRRPPWVALVGIWLLLSGSWLGLGWLSSTVDLSHPSPGEATAVLTLMLLGLGLLPLLLVGWVFARSFRDDGLSPEDLRRLRESQPP